MKIAVIDNYDSFTYNLVHYLENFNAKVKVYKNDAFLVNELEKFDKIVLSPGPGLPNNAGLLKSTIQTFYTTKPILGVCLGLQAINEVFGGTLLNLKQPLHGVATKITHYNNDFLYQTIPNNFYAGRYHSWCINSTNLPDELEVTAIDENQQIMSIKHKKYNIKGVQFHPESILTPYGKKIIHNWLEN